MTNINRVVVLLVAGLLLSACGEEDNRDINVPVTYNSEASGMAALGLTGQASITAYHINDSNRHCDYERLRAIGEGETDQNGRYRIKLNLAEGMVLYRMSDGSYIEKASGSEVHISRDQSVYAISHYRANNRAEVIITPWSSIQAGLFCYLIEEDGLTIDEAAGQADEFIVSYLGLDPRYVDYKDPSLAENNSSLGALNDGMLLGFINAGLSQLSYNLALEVDGADLAHHRINSIFLTQKFFADIYADGLLDGRSSEGRIVVGRGLKLWELSTPATHKVDLPKAILQFHDTNPRNQVKLARDQIFPATERINLGKGGIGFAADNEVPSIDGEPPELQWLGSDILSGTVNISLRANDLFSVSQVKLASPKVAIFSNVGDNLYTLRLDTRPYGSGRRKFLISATDGLGNLGNKSFDVILINGAPGVDISAANTSKGEEINIGISVTKSAPGQALDLMASKCFIGGESKNEYSIREEGGRHSCDIRLKEGINSVRARVCDINNLCGTSIPYPIKYDITPPDIQQVDLMDNYNQSVAFTIRIRDSLSAIKGPPSYQVRHRDGKTLEGHARILDGVNGGYVVSFNAERFGGGEISIVINASDSQDNLASKTFSTFVINNPASATLISPSVFRQVPPLFAFRINENSYSTIKKVSCRIRFGYFFTGEYISNQARCNSPLYAAAIADGEHQLELIIESGYGLTTTQVFNITKDSNPPVISFTKLEQRYSATGAEIVFGIEDRHLDENSIRYRIDNGVSQSAPIGGSIQDTLVFERGEELPPIKRGRQWFFFIPTTMPTGSHKILISAADALGNSIAENREFILVKDQPGITLSSPALTNKDAYTLTATIDPASYEGSYGGYCQLAGVVTPANINSGLLNCNLNLAESAEGQISITIKLIATYGETYTNEINIAKDTSPPIISFTQLEQTYIQTGGKILFRVEDPNLNQDTVLYSLDKGEEIAATKQGNEWFFIIPHELATGEHHIAIHAEDTMNHSTIIRRSFVLLKDQPGITLSSPAYTKEDAYTLTATIDPASYEGSYSGYCQLGRIIVPARVENNLLTCNLNFAPAREGDSIVRIGLSAVYGETYTNEIGITKDNSPPDIHCPFASSYGERLFSVSCQISDSYSRLGRVQYRDLEDSGKLIDLPQPYRIEIDPAEYASGSYTVTIVATDILGNNIEKPYSILIDKDPPVLHIPDRMYSQQQQIDLGGTYSGQDIATITCLSAKPNGGDVLAVLEQDGSFRCPNYQITDLGLEDRVGLMACDIHRNCATYYTTILHDNRPPIGTTFTSPMGSQFYRLDLRENRNGQVLSPPAFTLIQEKTGLNSSVALTEAALSRSGIQYVGWRGQDNHGQGQNPQKARTKRVYATNPANLSITYSYSQRDCAMDRADDEQNNCPDEKINYYFKDRILHPNLTQEGLAEVIIPFASEFLNMPNKPVWYLASLNIIHRLDLDICDETRNCLSYATRFRVKVIARRPIITDLPPAVATKRILSDVRSFTGSYSEPITTKIMQITNPSELPIFFAIGASQPATPILIKRRQYKRINAYYTKSFTDTYTGQTWTGRRGRSGSNVYNIYRCNYSGGTGILSGPHFIYMDNIPGKTTPPTLRSGETGWTTRCSTGTRITNYNTQANGYPKAVDASFQGGGNLLTQVIKRTNFFAALDRNNVEYQPNIYYRLSPGKSRIIKIQESLFNYNEIALPVALRKYGVVKNYNHYVVSNLDGSLRLSIAKPDHFGNPDRTTAEEYYRSTPALHNITTTTPITALPGAP